MWLRYGALLGIATVWLSGCSAHGAGPAHSASAPTVPVVTASESTGPAPLPSAAGVSGHRDDCPAFVKRRDDTVGHATCVDRKPTGLVSLHDDLERKIDTETLAQQICSIIPDAQAQPILRRFLVVILQHTGDPAGDETWTYTLDAGGRTGRIESSLVGTSPDLIKTFCVGPIAGGDVRVTIAGLAGSREGTSGIAATDHGYSNSWQYRLPIPDRTTGGANCLIATLRLDANWDRSGNRIIAVSPKAWNEVGLRFVSALAQALKTHAG